MKTSKDGRDGLLQIGNKQQKVLMIIDDAGIALDWIDVIVMVGRHSTRLLDWQQ